MKHAIEPAPSARAKCRGCGKPIAKAELRLGERLPNPYADDRDMTLWFHLHCGAFKRPEVLLEALDLHPATPDSAHLRALAQPGITHHRLPRVDGVERATSARARCRHCREAIEKASLRIRLVYYAEGRFEPSGFIHATCSEAYLGTTALRMRALHFSSGLDAEAARELEELLEP